LEHEPVFLAREQIDEIHRDQINEFGGLHGVRDEGALESALAQPINVYLYGEGDFYEIAAAYAYHIAESQAFFDGNKRTGAHAALDFLEINGVDTSRLPELAAYEAMIAVANHRMDRRGLGQFFREILIGNLGRTSKLKPMAKPMLYLTGEEIKKGDRVLLPGEAGEVDFVLDGENNPEAWPAAKYGRGIMVFEPRRFGHLFLTDAGSEDYKNLEFVSRSLSSH
jgi:death on curing protein